MKTPNTKLIQILAAALLMAAVRECVVSAAIARFGLDVLAVYYGACAAVLLRLACPSQRRESESPRVSGKTAVSPDFLVGPMTAGIAHNFRNYLSILTGSLALLRRATIQGPTVQRALQIQEKALAQANRMSSLLLAYARAEWNKEQHIEEIDTAVLIADAIELASVFLADHGIEIEQRFDAGLPAIRGDQAALMQSLINVIKNAGEASPANGKVIVSASAADDAPFVYLSIRDFGAGIDTAARETLFTPFASTKGGGHGLGLYTVRSLIEQSGGFININSEPGAGTEVIIRCPMAVEAAVVDSAAETMILR